MGKNLNNSKWSQQEDMKASKVKIKREYYLLKLLGVSGLVMAFFYVFVSDKATFSDTMYNFLRINYAEIRSNGLFDPNNSFQYGRYFLMYVPFFILFRMFFIGSSIAKLDKIKRIKKNYKKKISFIFKMKYKLIVFFEYISKYIAIIVDSTLPINGASDTEIKKKIGFHYGWLSHIQEDFINQEFVKVDAYERVKELEIFKNYHNIIEGLEHSEEAGNYILNLFKSKEDFEDLLKISEGYLTANGDEEKLFDTFLNEKETMKHLSKLNNFYSFKAFNEKDEVFYSQFLVENLVDLETKAFSKMLKKYITSNIKKRIKNPNTKNILNTKFYSDFSKYYILFLNQNSEITEKILYPEVWLENKKIEGKKPGDKIEELKISEEGQYQIIDRLVKIMEYYFRIIIFRIILSQYLNIPAGTAVSKIEDYSLRMIIEIYEEDYLVEISKNKNDGTSKSFKSDVYTNLFLVCFLNYSNKYGTISLENKMKVMFNFNFDEINKQLMQNPVFMNAKDGKLIETKTTIEDYSVKYASDMKDIFS